VYHLPYSPVRWQEIRRNFERALEIDSRSSEARIGLASILSTKLADGWSPVLQEDMQRAEHLLLEAVDEGAVFEPGGGSFYAWGSPTNAEPVARGQQRVRDGHFPRP